MSVETTVRPALRWTPYWTCDCQSEVVRQRAGHGVALSCATTCAWCGRSQSQMINDAGERRRARRSEHA